MSVGRVISTVLLVVFFGFFGSSCGTLVYVPPDTSLAKGDNVVTIDKPYAEVWDRAVPQIGKSFFVINNMDRSSGLMNVSYTGDPEAFLDCGQIHADAQGQRADFPESRAEEAYWRPSGGLFPEHIYRKLSLDGRANIVFEQITPSSTKITVTARYVVTMVGVAQLGNGATFPEQGTATFNSGEQGRFSSENEESEVVCVANGRFERGILALIQG